jgi:hypothetical protein
MLDFGKKISHTNTCNKTHFLSLLKVNEKGFKLGLQVEVTTLKVKIINFYFIHIIFSFHCVSILIHYTLLEDYFVWHLYMFI